MPAGDSDGGGDGVMKRQMVVLDQDGVKQSHSVIRASAACDGVLVEESQSRNGLASVRHFGFRTHYTLDIPPGERRDPAHALQHVQGHTLASQDGRCRAVNFRDGCSLCNRIPVLDELPILQARINDFKKAPGNGQSGRNKGLFCRDSGL